MPDILSFSILGLVEGVTEFLPVSSSGHLILVRDLLGMNTGNGLAMDAVLQLAGLLAIVVYFWRDLLRLARAALLGISGRPPARKEDERLILALIVGTLPALIIGFFLEKTMETVFRNPHLVAYALIAGSLVFLLAEYVSKKEVSGGMETVGMRRGLLIGFFQALALVPGMSRSGMTIAGGLMLGLSRDAAARFGFLLSVPIIAGSGLKKLLELSEGGELVTLGAPLLLGSAVAFFSGLLAIHGLLLFLRRYPLYVFAAYRVLLAVLILVFI